MMYVIEHLEPELFKWCIIEYAHISKIVGRDNLIFTNIKPEDKEILSKYGEVREESVSGMNLNNACVLDPNSDKVLSPEDKFDFLVFGGILGDNPPRNRTTPELTEKFKTASKRNMGKEQMTTNTAVYVAKKISEGSRIEDIRFAYELEVEIDEGESVVLPYRFVIDDDKPVLAEGLIEYLIKEKVF